MTTGTLICMMAKVPEPGVVKTRLCPPLDAKQAAALANAFLADTWNEVGRVANVDRILVFAGDPAGLPVTVQARQLWRQVEGDLGARMEHVLARGLAHHARVIIIGSDAPGLPARLIERAARCLMHSDTVIGPALDGGFYLIGASRVHPGLLSSLPWSQQNTRSATYKRLRACGYSVARLPPWFDVDDASALALLERVLSFAAIRAPQTRACLRAIVPQS